MEANSLNCPNCGAAARMADPQCGHCGAKLATVSCPACFGMMFFGSRFCPRCGAEAQRRDLEEKMGPCPRCHLKLGQVRIGPTTVAECGKCHGLWLDVVSFQKICAESEKTSAALEAPAVSRPPAQKVEVIRYLRCPQCDKLMHRVNFGNCSGVIVDICKGHGTWFDCDELRRIIEFIQRGGLDQARAKEKAQLDEQWRRLRRAQARAAGLDSGGEEFGSGREMGIGAARVLLDLILD